MEYHCSLQRQLTAGSPSEQAALNSDVLGPVHETFHWAIKGTSHPLALVLKGTVVGPTFALDVQQLQFGLVALGFRCGESDRGSNL